MGGGSACKRLDGSSQAAAERLGGARAVGGGRRAAAERVSVRAAAKRLDESNHATVEGLGGGRASERTGGGWRLSELRGREVGSGRAAGNRIRFLPF